MNRSHSILSARLLAAALCAGTAFAEESATNDSEAQRDVVNLDRVVVTGRAGTGVRTKAETSYAITDLSHEQLRLQAPMGVAESLKAVPGFWVESSGGEASANIRARGIPVEGYSMLSLQEDGLPIQHDSGLGWMNADQSFRLDETVDRMEVVRGGPASLFAPNAPGGVVNYVTRLGGDTPEGLVKYEIGDFGRHRVDAWYGGPAGDWRYALGGFWRIDHGVRDPGFRANDGYQARFSLGRKFERGSIDANVKHFDDHVVFYLGVPLTFDSGGDTAAVPGFDANYGTFLGPETRYLVAKDAAGDRVLDLKSGTHVRLTQVTLKGDWDLGGGWKIEEGFRYRDSDTVRAGLFPATLTVAANRLAALRAGAVALYPTATDVRFRYVSTPTVYFDTANQNGNGLVLDASAREIGVSLEEAINDLRLVKQLEIGDQKHDLAFGYYFADVSETFKRYSANLFTDVRDNARVLDLVAVDGSGNVVGSMTENGFSRYGAEFANGSGDSRTHAFYGSDEWQLLPQLRIDLGGRWERIHVDGKVERIASRNLGGAGPQDDNVLTGTGVFDPFARSFDKFGWTVGADWQFTPRNGVFARATPTFRLPSLGDYITNPTAKPITQKIDLYEAGYKYVSQPFDVFATAFLTRYHNFGFGELVYDPATGSYISRTAYTDTKTYGVELESNWRAAAWFDLSASATLQKPEFGDFTFTELVNGAPVQRDYTGHQLLRVPETSFRIVPGTTLLNRRLRIQVPVEHYGRRFADAANSVRLPSYTVVNVSLRYDVNRWLTLYANGDNLFNEIGLTEGNPRAGQFQSGEAGARYYLGRPILGRSLRVSALIRF
ncbi:cyclic nucleotide-binding protein [Opitutaceae bacterium EW11]|nr:cyclic nucleotide-binding protein [Opitutaceae bacterium EW11]